MKHNLIILATAAVLFSCGNSNRPAGVSLADPTTDKQTVETAVPEVDTVGYTGTYYGMLPCADCDGIEVRLKVQTGGEYEYSTKHIMSREGEKHIETHYEGAYSWNPSTQTLTLNGITNQPNRYLYADGMLTQLDMAGKVITGPLADKYVLKKQHLALLPNPW